MRSFKWFLGALFGLGSLTTAQMHAQPGMMSGNWAVDLEYLYWKAKVDQTPYALQMTTTSSVGPVPSAPTGDIFIAENNLDMGSGCRLGLDYFFPSSNWNLGFDWTLFQTNTSHQLFTNFATNDVVYGTYFSSYLFFNIAAASAKSNWNLHVNTFALGSHYSLELPWGLKLSPSGGLGVASIRQRQNVEYLGMLDDIGSPITANVQIKNNFWGIGPKVGLDFAWNFYRDFELLSRLEGVLLGGNFDIKTNYTFFSVNANANSFVKEHAWRIRPMIDSAFGFGWNGYLWKRPVTFAALYELQYWWRQWHAPGSTITFNEILNYAPWEDLMLHGLTLSLNFSL